MAGFTAIEMHIMAHNIVDEYENSTGKKLSYKEYNEQMKKWEKFLPKLFAKAEENIKNGIAPEDERMQKWLDKTFKECGITHEEMGKTNIFAELTATSAADQQKINSKVHKKQKGKHQCKKKTQQQNQ